MEHAKKKVRQQAKQIKELEEKTHHNGLEEHTRKIVILKIWDCGNISYCMQLSRVVSPVAPWQQLRGRPGLIVRHGR